MRFWRYLLGGLLLWSAHFFAIYGIASLWPGSRTAVLLVAMVTALLLAAAAWLFARALRCWRTAKDDLERWNSGLALLGYTIAGAAICLQALPGFFA